MLRRGWFEGRISAEWVLALAVSMVLATLLIPLPPAWVDLGIALSLALSVTLLVASLGAREALQVSAFPTALLVTTLFRLALNVASTRLALSEGHAGRVIEAFGTFVIRGDYVVGAVVFAILALIQFLVVTKGAERVAEVSARFSLDAMPGKQMSIDADLRAGAIDQAQARSRRRHLERESQLFGAMDGAMKFVKGDVVAGLIITLVNLAGGTAIGALHHGMALGEAASVYALIAIGDGLASQIPSLAVTVAAGIVVTRVAPEEARDGLGTELVRQFFGRAQVLWVVAALCLAIALIPGMPPIPFLLLALGAGALAWRADHREAAAEAKAKQEDAAQMQGSDAAGEGHHQANQALSLPESPLVLELAPDLTPLAQEEGAAFVHRELEALRDALFGISGVRIPGFCVRAGVTQLPRGSYRLLLHEVPLGQGHVEPGAQYARCAPEALACLGVSGTEAEDPGALGPLTRIDPVHVSRLEAAGIRTRSSGALICDHLAILLKGRLAPLLGVQEVQGLLDALEPSAPVLVREVLQKVPLPLLTDVLRRLVREEVPIRPLRPILDALLSPTAEGDAPALAELCRSALWATLSHRHAHEGALYAWLVDPEIEAWIREQQQGAPAAPERITRLLESVQGIASQGRAVVLAAPDIRATLRRLCEGSCPEVAVLTYGELDPALRVHPLGKLAA
ncbi:MAG TPA: flagellar biosynthesis protein FlhA [Myxococcaceae bacterium]|nr:flagellar biosynthesis protein FlhA [Myxococcaceae bacterium]